MLAYSEFTAMIARAYHVHDMTSKNGRGFLGLVHRRSVLNWHLLSGIGLLFFMSQEIQSKHVSGLRLARRSLTLDDLVRGLNPDPQMPDGFRMVESKELKNPLLGQIIHLDRIRGDRENTDLGPDFRNWIRENHPVAKNSNQEEIYHRSDLRAAWYIYLKSKRPDLYLKHLGETSIIEAVERQADRSGLPERTIYSFLDQVFGTDGDQSAMDFLKWIEGQFGHLERNKFYDLKGLYRNLIAWILERRGTMSYNDFPRKNYYIAWVEQTHTHDSLIKVINREIYPLSGESRKRSTLDPSIPKVYAEHPISAQAFLDFVGNMMPNDDYKNFRDWFREKHSLTKRRLQNQKFHRHDLALHLVEWVSEKPQGNSNQRKVSSQLLQIIKNHHIDGAIKDLVNREIYPLAKDSWQISELEPLLPRGYFEHQISTQTFLEFLKEKMPENGSSQFFYWFMKKHSLVKEKLQDKMFPRGELALNFVRWVDEQLLVQSNPASKSTQVLQTIRDSGIEGASEDFLHQLNDYLCRTTPGMDKKKLEQKPDIKLGKLSYGMKLKLKEHIDAMNLGLHEKELFKSYILDMTASKEEFNKLYKSNSWNDEDLENTYQKWNPQNLKGYTIYYWCKIKDLYGYLRNWFDGVIYSDTQESNHLKAE